MGSTLSYLYYKQSVDPSSAAPAAQAPSSVRAINAIPIRHRPTTYSSKFERDELEAAPEAEKN
jgi:hypothetical protein